MTYPSFSVGEVLRAQDMNAVGLWLVKSQAVGTGVSSVTVTGAFSAEYDNYLVTYTGGSQSVDTATMLQLGGSTTGYYGTFVYGAYTGGSPINAALNNATSFIYAGGGSSCSISCQILLPFQSIRTKFSAQLGYQTTYGSFSGIHDVVASYTSFTIIPFSGALTGGTIRVYGYRN
jgi:hypothetical protein